MKKTAAPSVTADHRKIRSWAEKHHGKPALIREAAGAIDPGEPRIKFSDEEKTLKDVGWDEFLKEFDRRRLALLTIQNGEDDTFFRLVSRDIDFEDTIRPLEDDAPIVWNGGR